MNEDPPETTADQDAWVALCEATRSELSKLIPLIPAMKVDEAKSLVDTIQAAMWAHAQACTFDKRVDLELARTSPLFG